MGKIKSRRIFKGKLLNISLERVRMPHGVDVDIELIHHPGAVLVVPFLSSNRIVLLRQFRPAIKRYLYEAPAGTLKVKESPLACVRRELIEETGLGAKKFKKLGLIYPVPGYSTEKIHIFKAWDLYPQPGQAEDDECLKPFKISKPEVAKLFKAGKLIDAKTIAALVMCGWL